MANGIFIEGIRRPVACESRLCPFYQDGDMSGPDYCMIQYAQGVSAFKTVLHDMEKCPCHPCSAEPRYQN